MNMPQWSVCAIFLLHSSEVEIQRRGYCHVGRFTSKRRGEALDKLVQSSQRKVHQSLASCAAQQHQQVVWAGSNDGYVKAGLVMVVAVDRADKADKKVWVGYDL